MMGRSTVKSAVGKAGSRPRSGSRDNILHELISLNRTTREGEVIASFDLPGSHGRVIQARKGVAV
jgi:hypothetical protein